MHIGVMVKRGGKVEYAVGRMIMAPRENVGLRAGVWCVVCVRNGLMLKVARARSPFVSLFFSPLSTLRPKQDPIEKKAGISK